MAIKAGPGRFQHVKKNLKMNPFSQTRILLMYFILISEGWTWVGLPPPPLSPLPHLVSLLPSQSGACIARGNFPSFPLSLFFPIFSPLSPSSLPPHLLPLPLLTPSRPPFNPVRSLLNASVILTLGYQR